MVMNCHSRIKTSPVHVLIATYGTGLFNVAKEILRPYFLLPSEIVSPHKLGEPTNYGGEL